MLVHEGRGGCKLIAYKVRPSVPNEMPQIINIYRYIAEISLNSTVYIPQQKQDFYVMFS